MHCIVTQSSRLTRICTTGFRKSRAPAIWGREWRRRKVSRVDHHIVLKVFSSGTAASELERTVKRVTESKIRIMKESCGDERANDAEGGVREFMYCKPDFAVSYQKRRDI